MTLNPIGHSVGQRFIIPSAVQGHKRFHSSMYNRAGVIFIPRFLKKRLAPEWILTGECMESAAPTDCFCVNFDAIGTSSELSVISNFELSPLETYHALPLERINSRTAFAAFTNGGTAAIIITQNTTASQAKCWGASFIK
jgi:hypothetical protein